MGFGRAAGEAEEKNGAHVSKRPEARRRYPLLIPRSVSTTPFSTTPPSTTTDKFRQLSSRCSTARAGRGVALSGDDRRPPAAAPPALGRARRPHRGAEDRAGALRGDPGSDRGGRDGRRDPLDAAGRLGPADPALHGISRPVVVPRG